MINKTPKKKNKLDYQNIKTELNIRNYAIKTFRAIIFFPAFPASAVEFAYFFQLFQPFFEKPPFFQLFQLFQPRWTPCMIATPAGNCSSSEIHVTHSMK